MTFQYLHQSLSAQNILCFGYGECYSNIPGSDEQARRKARRTYNLQKTTINNSSKISTQLTPNPANDKVQFIISGELEFSNLTLLINSIEGKQLKEETILSSKTILKLSSLSPGIYFFQLKDNSERKSSGKFIKK